MADLRNGDCMVELPTLEPGSVDMVITDPPYGINFQSNMRVVTDKLDKIANDEYPFVWWVHGAARALTDGGGVLCFCRWDVQEAFRLALTWAGLTVRAQVVWDREAHGTGDLKGQPAPSHDVIWYATKGRREFAGRRPRSVIRVMRINGNQLKHPNEKPLTLLAELVDDYTKPDDTVMDCFMGVGNTGVAAVSAGRKFIGIELCAKHFARAERRITAAQDTLFAVD